MIVIGDWVEIAGADKNLVGEVIGKRKVGSIFIYDVQVGKLGMFSVTDKEINGEVYEWYVVTDIHHHPTPEELNKCPKFRATAARVARHRISNPELRVRLKTGVDSVEEMKKLRVVFDPQDAYESKQFGMHDMVDAAFKAEPDPTTQIRMRDLLRVQENTNLNSLECQSFSCNNNTKGHCKNPSFRSDVHRCPKHTSPHTGHFTDEDDQTHLSIPGIVRNEIDQTNEE